tara:strand:+ start:480 stop:2210 length:1731 start_codon:yes stop_codon:yes gene_type:complete
MKVAFFSIISICLFLVGCGKGDDHDHALGEEGGDWGESSGESQPQQSSRPASKLKEVQAVDAGKTPLNLSLFLLQEKKSERGYDYAVATLAVAVAESGDLDAASQVALLSPKGRGTVGLVYLVKKAAEAGDAATALKVAQWIEPADDRAVALCRAATAQAKGGNPAAALATIKKAEGLARNLSQKDKANALIEIATAQLAAGKKQQAVATCNQALKAVQANRNGFENANAYKRLARVLVGAGEIQTVKEMIQPGKDMFSRTLNASARTSIAAIMAEAGEVEAALEWVGQFPARDNQKKAEAYGNIAKALAKKGKFKEALEVLKNDKSMFSSKSDAMGDIAEGLAKTGKIKEAQALVSQIRGGMAQEPALRAIASAQVAAGNKEAALETLKQADEAADKVADIFRPKWEVLVASALGLAEAGEKELAMAKLKEAAEEVMKGMKLDIREKKRFYASGLSQVRESMSKIGDHEGAAALLKKVLELVKEIKDTSKKTRALNIIESSLSRAGDFKGAMKMIQLMEDAEERKDQMRIMAESLAKTDRRGHFEMTIDITCLKKSFTPEEQAFAKQLVEAMQGE